MYVIFRNLWEDVRYYIMLKPYELACDFFVSRGTFFSILQS